MSGSSGRLETGVSGLDELLHGGLIEERGYMVRGPPGSGKTILGMHFLTAADDDETSLFVALEEDEGELRANGAAVGIDLEGISFLDLGPDADAFGEDRSYDIFAASEVEGAPFARELAAAFDDVEPDRVFIDPLTQLRYLTPDIYQFRTQVSGFMQFLEDREATVLFTSQATANAPDDDLQFLSHGVIDLDVGDGGRSISVRKFRGSDFEGGRHAIEITEGGFAVYPRLAPETFATEFTLESVSSGVPAIDALLDGGIERGTVTILSGPTGVGKTTLGTQFMKEAAGRGERSVIYLFEESEATFVERTKSVNVPVMQMRDRGTLQIETVEALTRSADEFAHEIRREVEERDTSIVMIDGIEGYRLSVRGDDSELTRELHRLCRYLKNMGVTVILVEEIDSVTGEFKATSRNVSYLADTVVFLRYMEVAGELRKAIGVLKKRTGDFERALREFEITEHGIVVGEPLTNLRGILSGSPEVVSDDPPARDGPR